MMEQALKGRVSWGSWVILLAVGSLVTSPLVHAAGTMERQHKAASSEFILSQQLAADVPLPAPGADDVMLVAGSKPKGSSHGDRAYKRFTQKGKGEVKAENAEKHDGVNRCENCGVQTVPSQQSQKGVTPPKNETQVDHVIPKAKGGNGSPDNGQVLCRECNNEKSDKIEPGGAPP